MISAVLTNERCELGFSRSNNHQQCREAGRNIVGNIVDMCSPTAKILIPLRPIANHRIECVHHLIGHHPGNTQYCQPEQGGYDTIAQILSQRFQGSGTHFLGREFRGVTPHDTGNLYPALFQGPVNGTKDGTHLTNQCGASQTIEDQHG